MSPKEKVKDFNQTFTSILNKFQPEVRPTPELQIEVYFNAPNFYFHVRKKGRQEYSS
jgi:hypothetical protein